jgi:hypothetical protein
VLDICKRREDPDATDVFQVVETDIHLVEIPGTETVFFPELLFVKGIEGEAVKRVIDHVLTSDL